MNARSENSDKYEKGNEVCSKKRHEMKAEINYWANMKPIYNGNSYSEITSLHYAHLEGLFYKKTHHFIN
jgi:hypothetical protein